MDEFLSRLGVQAVNYAMRCGIALTSSFALQQCSRLVKTVDDKAQQAELHALQKTLDSKIKIISPALDLVEFRSGRGNVFLENAATLARALHRDIVALGRQLENAAATEEEPAHEATRPFRTKAERCAQVAEIISAIRRLLVRIDGDIPLLQLAITASGESLSTALPPSISPSRLLQASMLLTVGDTQFSSGQHCRPVQIGPVFTLSLYMLFLGHSSTATTGNNTPPVLRPDSETPNRVHGEKETQSAAPPYGLGKSERKPIWQEVLHKARVRLCRTPPDWRMDHESSCRPQPGQPQSPSSVQFRSSRVPRNTNVASYLQQDAYAYHLEIIEDLDDGRVHEDSDEEQQQGQQQQQGQTCDSVRRSGIQELIPICQVSKIFYADTGRILNIGPADGCQSNAVLLLKRDTAAAVPTPTMEHMQPRPETEVSCLVTDAVEDGTAMLHDKDLSEPTLALSHDEQHDVNRQLQAEMNGRVMPAESSRLGAFPGYESEGMHRSAKQRFPAHLDPEWLALEVFAEDADDQDDGSSEDEDNADGAEEQNGNDQANGTTLREPPTARGKPAVASAPDSSVDSQLLDQFRNLAKPDAPAYSRSPPATAPASGTEPAQFVAQSPFGAVATSLSLLEMLVRLTSLQEFQQTSHLAIPDHILTFFLEETSTTGLRGDARWQAKQAARRRVGFDPYTDSPTKERKYEYAFN